MKFRIYLLLVVCYFLQFSSIFAQQPPLQQCRKNATFSNETLQSLNNTVNQGSAQIDSDEHIDLYFIHQASQQIEFWFGDGTGGFPTKVNFNSGDVHDLAFSDFNLDGLNDLLVLNQSQDR